MVFSPLDWGLGHTTRSIPVLQTLERLGFSLIIACNSTQFKILRSHFPGARFESLDGYSISLGKSRAGTLFQIGRQAPKILTGIKKENAWIKHFCLAEKPDLVLSDSRFGFWFPGCPSIMLTHQLQIRTGLGTLADRLVNHYNRHWLSHFNQIWVADHAQAPDALAGTLSAGSGSRLPITYLGPLSRFTQSALQQDAKENRVTALLSGPEPQRSLLEAKLLEQAIASGQTLTLVRGLPATTALPILPSHITCYNHLDTAALQQLLAQSALVISRSGYSSLMDYAAMGVKAILVPTPGQAEQEYLANRCHQKGWALSLSQDSFDLNAALATASSFPYKPFPPALQPLEKTMAESLASLGVLPVN